MSAESPTHAISITEALKRTERAGWPGTIFLVGRSLTFACVTNAGTPSQPVVRALLDAEEFEGRVDMAWEGLGADSFLYQSEDTREFARILNILIQHPNAA